MIDITGKLESGMWSCGPPMPDVAVERVAVYDTHGYDAHAFRLHGLAGTYLETARHLFEGRERLDEVSPERLFLRAWVAQLADKEPHEPITAEELAKAADGLSAGDALLIATGWDSRWHSPEFLTQSPYLEDAAMEWIIQQDVSLLGVDITSIEDIRVPGGKMPLLERYYAKDRLLMAPLVRLREAGAGPWELAALPLHIGEACAAPCRAVLRKLRPQLR